MPNHPDNPSTAKAIEQVSDRPDLLTDPQARRAYALLLVRTLWPAVSASDARRVATWVVRGRFE